MVLVRMTDSVQVPSSPSLSRSSTSSEVLAGPTPLLSLPLATTLSYLPFVSAQTVYCTATNTSISSGFLRWYSRLYRNQGSLLFGPGRPDWGEQLVVVTGGTFRHAMCARNLNIVAQGSSGIGELIANTLAVRNVTAVVLDVKPIVTENCE